MGVSPLSILVLALIRMPHKSASGYLLHCVASREFCNIVRKIFIYTKEEVQKMNSKSSAPRKEEGSGDADGANEKAHLATSSHLDN